jgi:uridine kinase
MITIELNQLERVISQIKNLTENNPNKRLIIAISGGSATGKTSQVSDEIDKALVLNTLDSSTLSQDNFQLGKDFIDQFDDKAPSSVDDKKLFEQIQLYKWDLPLNFDYSTCLDTLNKIYNNEINVTIPNFDVKAVTRLGTKVLKPAKITIFEGLYSFDGILNNFPFDLKIYVETPFYARLLRRYFRFVYQMNIPKPDKALKQIFTTVLKAHIDFVEKQKKDADFVITVPYDFNETITRLNLQPNVSISLSDYKVESSLCFNNTGQILVNSKDNKFYFTVKYNDLIWECLEISNELKDTINNVLNNSLTP